MKSVSSDSSHENRTKTNVTLRSDGEIQAHATNNAGSSPVRLKKAISPLSNKAPQSLKIASSVEMPTDQTCSNLSRKANGLERELSCKSASGTEMSISGAAKPMFS